ncbi:Gfo/Idh/MocA family protein [Streptomyces sp. Agncl-13]|uniref:Gfo/Idh/MocA family protein n=1 Tax=Streptomyces sp. Agncl-13 TaxID=3400628 RepID=UPI003A8A268C
MNVTSRLRLLLVGAGAMGSHHGRVIAESRRCELVAVVDPDEDRGRGLARRYGAVWAPEVESFSRIDAVVVASSTDQHRQISLDALSEGIPLFVEKPLCADLGDSRRIVDVALRGGIPLMCGFIERFNPAVIEAVAHVEAPDAVYAQRISTYSPRMHAGVSWDLLVHDVDIALRVFGEEIPKIQYAATTCLAGEGRIGEETVAVELEFSDARAASLSASRIASRKARRLAITERDRTVIADLLTPSVTVYAGSISRPFLFEHDLGSGPEVLSRTECSDYREPLAAQLDGFLDIVQGERDMHAETCSILPSHETVAAILDSAEESADFDTAYVK